MALRHFALIFALGWLSLGSVHAEERDARSHYERGTALFDLGKYREAAVEYEKAYEIKSVPALLFNLGQTYRLAGDHTAALRAYRVFLRRSPAARERPEVEARIEELQQLVDREKQATANPPSGVIRQGSTAAEPISPVEKVTPAVVAPEPIVTSPVVDSANVVVVTPAPAKKPIYKRWWLWTAVGVVVVGVAVGVGVAVSTPNNAAAPAGAYTVRF